MDNNHKKADKNMDKNANAKNKNNNVEFANEMDAKNNKSSNCK